VAYRSHGGAVLDRTGENNWVAELAAPSIVPGPPHDHGRPASTERTAAARLPHCPEIDCVRHLLPPSAVALAELRAAEAEVGAERVLIAEGFISEETYVVHLAASLGLAFEPLDDRTRLECPLADDRLVEAAATGLLPLVAGDDISIVVVPGLVDSRRLVALAASGADIARRVRLTSTARLQEFAAHFGAEAIERRSVEGLRDRHPECSAGGGHRRHLTAALLATAMAAACLAASGTALMVVEAALGAVFLAWTGLRLFGLFSERFVRRQPRAFADDRLPVYTIIVALYREAAQVKDLVAALRRLDYPAEKLDIKLVLEPDDDETREAVERVRPGPFFEVIIAPKGGPRTKPKALNAALPFARGAFVAVYDAEDRPEPDQLRVALEAFVAADERLACVQARLTIDNAADSWLTRLFTAEYAGLFDVFLPGLSAWRLPLPLGGSSNHFRTAVLRQVGAWDPYNVTEDADLGMRLARFGYRAAVIPSTTYEEAPARYGVWLRQRTRWLKGWVQTWLVHMRAPRRAMRELGTHGFLVFQLLVGGTVMAALVHSLFVAQLLWGLASVQLGGEAGPNWRLHVAILLAGYLISAALGLIGLKRRRLLGCAWALLLIPLYWLLLSVAAWRALTQLVLDPYRWEKTEHGLARTSRLARRARDSASSPLPPLRAAA
jgi:cellulose synthase/poly-beta-1,6-N-acetylglucosamine synthase-like glycosyltransferase